MNADDIYDPQGQGATKEEWEALPLAVRAHTTLLQQALQSEIDRENPRQFRPSSGWRSPRGNRAVGGVHNSDHLKGLARDFVRVGGCRNCPPRVGGSFQVIRSKGCWHVRIINPQIRQVTHDLWGQG